MSARRFLMALAMARPWTRTSAAATATTQGARRAARSVTHGRRKDAVWSLLLAAVLGAGAALTAAPAVAAPAAAEHRKVVDGLAISVGVMPADQLLRSDAYERASHRDEPANATHHIVVGIANAKTGDPVGDATVTLELVDPRGGVQSRTLARGNPGGVPDYSALFRFGWSGAYKLQVKVDRPGVAPVRSTFEWTQSY